MSASTYSMLLMLLVMILMSSPSLTSSNTLGEARLMLISNTTILSADATDAYSVGSTVLEPNSDKIYILLYNQALEGAGPSVVIFKIDSPILQVEGKLTFPRDVVGAGDPSGPILIYNSTLAYVWLRSTDPNSTSYLLGEIDLDSFQVIQIHNISDIARKQFNVNLGPSNPGVMVPSDESFVVPVIRGTFSPVPGLLKFELFPKFKPVQLVLPYPIGNGEGLVADTVGFSDSSVLYFQTFNAVVAFNAATMTDVGPVNVPNSFLTSNDWTPVPGTHNVVFVSAQPEAPPYSVVVWDTDNNQVQSYNGTLPPTEWVAFEGAASEHSFGYVAINVMAGNASRVYCIDLDSFPDSSPEYIEIESRMLVFDLVASADGKFWYTTQSNPATSAVFLLQIQLYGD